MKLIFKLSTLAAKDCDTCIFFVLEPPDDKDNLWGNQFDDFGKCVNADANQRRVNDFTEKHWGCDWHISIRKKL